MPPTPVYEYCSLDDVTRFGVSATALRSIPAPDLKSAIVSTSRFIDSFLKAADYSLPLTRVGEDMKEAASAIADWRLLKVRGYNPDDPAHPLLRQDYLDKEAWLKMIVQGQAIPDVDDSSGSDEPPPTGGRAVVTSNESRGWSDDGSVFGANGAPFTGGSRR